MARTFIVCCSILVITATSLPAQDKKIISPKKALTAFEQKIIDTIYRLPEVKKRADYVKTHTNGTRQLKYTIWTTPAKSAPYYWIKVMEDNGGSYYTHFNFYLYPASFLIKYLDPGNGNAIRLEQWRKMKTTY